MLITSYVWVRFMRVLARIYLSWVSGQINIKEELRNQKGKSTAKARHETKRLIYLTTKNKSLLCNKNDQYRSL